MVSGPKVLRRWLAAGALLAAFGPAQAVQCVMEGSSFAYLLPGSSEMVFLQGQPDGDYLFQLPAGEYQHNDGPTPSVIAFALDGVRYRLLTTDGAAFSEEGQSMEAIDLLPRFAAWVASAPANESSSRVYELARTRRPGYESTPDMYFLRWRLGSSDALDMNGIYFLSTVIGSRVVTLQAYVEKPEQLAQVLARLDRFATSYRRLEATEACPAAAGNPLASQPSP